MSGARKRVAHLVLRPGVEAQNAVVNAWARQGDLEKAWAWRPLKPTLATYAALLAGCAPWLSWI